MFSGGFGSNASSRWRYALKEEQATVSTLPYLDFGARLYDPFIGLWTSVDPLAASNPYISPYTYCDGNPVNMVDPFGMDIWEIDKNGAIISVRKDEEKDAFYIAMATDDGSYKRIKDSDGNDVGITFEHGTVESYSSDNGKHALFHLVSNQDGSALFKFLADNTDVEFGYIGTNDYLSSVFTDNEVNKIDMIKKANGLLSKGNSISIMMHNHPKQTVPSGFNVEMKDGDKRVAEKMKGKGISFYVYRSLFNAVLPYNDSSCLDKNLEYHKIHY